MIKMFACQLDFKAVVQKYVWNAQVESMKMSVKAWCCSAGIMVCNC